MGDARPDLGRGMRLLLLGCGAMNAAGAAAFAPPFSAARRAAGLPDAHPLYLWTLAAWVLAFGVAFARMGLTGRADRGVLALAAWGKGAFAGLALGLAAAGDLPPLAAAAAAPDLALAGVFAAWLWRSRRSPPPRDEVANP